MRLKILSCISLMLILFSSCSDDVTRTVTYTANVPIYMSYDEFRQSVEIKDVQTIEKPGKIMFWGNYIFINDKNKGVHIIDNTDPSNPKNIKFIKIPGCIDMALKDNYLYLDSYVDLVIFDVSDINNPQLKKRVYNTLNMVLPEYDPDYPIAHIDTSKGVVVGFEVKEVTEEYKPVPILYFNSRSEYVSSDMVASYSPAQQSVGVSGSLARFTISDNYIYIINDYLLNTYDISNYDSPKLLNKVVVGNDAETIFTDSKYLYIGTQSGIKIYNITNKIPSYVSTYWHITGCDPVVVDDTTAYFTIHSGDLCGNNVNLLEVVGLGDVYNPKFLASYDMYNPYGLGIKENLLFVCDSDEGLKIFDITESPDLTLVKAYKDIKGYDVIPLDDKLILIADDGVYQYEYSGTDDINLISEYRFR